jgi:methionine sulfoxide reductase heme-binding subunit
MSSLLAVADLGQHGFWITSRAAGVVALVLSSLSVSLGLVSTLRMFKQRGTDLRALHESLSLATLVALAVHAVALLGDSFLSPSLADVTIPFVSGYQRWWTTTGIVAGWAMIALGASYYVRRRIGTLRWRKLHRWTAVAWVLGIVHSLGEGTDAGQTWFLAMTAIVVVPALALLVIRHLPRPTATPAGGEA